MIRNLKALGLALAAVFALSAAAASVASAQQGTLTSDGPVTLTGTETGASANRVTMFGAFAECPGSTGTGHKYTVESETTAEEKAKLTHHVLIPSGATTYTLTPHLKQANENCVLSLGWKATTDFNGCDYVTHIGQTTGGVAGTYGGTVDIVCPPGKEIDWTLFTNAADLTSGTVACVLHVKPQTGLTGAHGTDTGNGTIDITGTIHGIHITKTKPNNHTILCQNETTATAEFHIDATVTGHNAAGASTPISLSHP